MESIVHYFKRITGLKPTKEQKIVLNALADIKISNLCLSCGRGFSKTMLSAVATLWFADIYATATGKPLEILLVSGQKRMYWHLNNFFRNNPDIDIRLKKHGVFDRCPVDGFELDNGSRVGLALATSQSIRSNRADIIFVDEACLVKNEIYRRAILPVSTGDIAKIVLLSTPSTNNFFTVIASNPKKHGFVLMQFSAELASWQKKSNARLKKTLSPAEYATEVLGRPPTKAERAYFKRTDLDKRIMEIEPTREGGKKSTVEAGIDFGYGKVNQTVLVITEKLGTKRKVLLVKSYREFDAKDLARILDEYQPSITKADSQPKEFQGKIEQYTKLKIHYIDARIHKEHMISQLQRRVRLPELIIPTKFIKLYKEMVRYRRPNKEDKKLGVRIKRAGDNRVDALALSCYEPPTPIEPRKKIKFNFPTEEKKND